MKSNAWALVAALTLTSGAAWADVIEPDEEACQGKSVGAACTVDDMVSGTPGTCTESTCTSASYTCDGATNPQGGPCGSTTSPCLLCEATDGGAASDAGHPVTDSGAGATDSGTSTSHADSGTATSPPADNGSGGCSLSPGSFAGSVGPWLIAGIVPLVVRRRRNKKAA